MTETSALWLTAVFVGVLCLFAPAVRGGGDELPDPDLAAIARIAQRADSKKSYPGGLPVRRRECIEAATPYLTSGAPDRMVWGERMLIECYSAMLIKLADVYYDPKTFGPGGMRALLKRVRRDLEVLYTGIYQGRVRCVVECGPMDAVAVLTAQRKALEDAARTMAGANVPDRDYEGWHDAWPWSGGE